MAGEHCFSARQTNEEVVRKRTSELVREKKLRVIEGREDPDGVHRDWFEVAEEKTEGLL